MISDEYRKLNEQMHAEHPKFGVGGYKWAQVLLPVIKVYGANTILDYGCGKGTLKPALRRHSPVQVFEYDPAVIEKSQPPGAADLVVCTDVLEHVEPEHIAAVLEHIQSVARKGVFFNVGTAPAEKTLADGRNAHISLHPAYWWFNLLTAYFDIDYFNVPDPRCVNISGRVKGALWNK